MVIVIALVVIALGLGTFAVISATGLSSTKSDLHNAQKTLKATKDALDKATTALTQIQSQLSDANATKTNQSSQLAAYKACINDLNVLFSSTVGTPAEVAAGTQAQKDCRPLGLG